MCGMLGVCDCVGGSRFPAGAEMHVMTPPENLYGKRERVRVTSLGQCVVGCELFTDVYCLLLEPRPPLSHSSMRPPLASVIASSSPTNPDIWPSKRDPGSPRTPATTQHVV